MHLYIDTYCKYVCKQIYTLHGGTWYDVTCYYITYITLRYIALDIYEYLW